MTPEELIQALPQHEPEPLSGDALHQWFADWIKSFRQRVARTRAR